MIDDSIPFFLNQGLACNWTTVLVGLIPEKPIRVGLQAETVRHYAESLMPSGDDTALALLVCHPDDRQCLIDELTSRVGISNRPIGVELRKYRMFEHWSTLQSAKELEEVVCRWYTFGQQSPFHSDGEYAALAHKLIFETLNWKRCGKQIKSWLSTELALLRE